METNLEKAQRINLILLQEIDRVCKKYSLNYYLICGGLLGAVRHHGFIPWDDDVDIAMTRKDYEILRKIAKDEWKGSDFLFVRHNDMKHGAWLDFFDRLVYMKEEVPLKTFEKIRGKGRKDIDNHVPLDIYVLDHAPDDEKKFRRMYLAIQGLYGLAMGHRAYVDFTEYEKQDPKLQKQIKALVSCGKWMPLWLIEFAYEKICRLYENKPGNDYFTSNGFIFCIPMRHKREWFAETTELNIYEHKFKCPKMYHEYLTFFYKDYMRLPPEDKRKPDHVIMQI